MSLHHSGRFELISDPQADALTQCVIDRRRAWPGLDFLRLPVGILKGQTSSIPMYPVASNSRVASVH